MLDLPQIDYSMPTRDLVRILRSPPEQSPALPESLLWRAWLELRRRGEAGAGAQFISGLKSLHRRRTMGNGGLPVLDHHSDEHRLTPDPYLSELWRSYKRAICANRTGPAAQLLRELEQQLQAH